MTKVTFYKKNGVYYGFRETGHAGMSDGIGVDELCAGLSAMTMLVVNTIEVSFAGTVNYMYDPDTTDVQVISEDALPCLLYTSVRLIRLSASPTVIPSVRSTYSMVIMLPALSSG